MADVEIGSTQIDPAVLAQFGQQPAQSSELGRGLRSGFDSTIAEGQALAGRAAETIGLDQAGKYLYDAAAAREAQATAEGPTIASWDQVHGVRDALDYGAGMIGKSAIPLAAGLVGGAMGKGRLGGIAGATAATVPFTAGGQVLSQQADPEQAARSVGLRNAIGGSVALGQAVASNIVPQIVGGKIVGRGAEHVAYETMGKTVAKNVAEAVGGNAAATAGGEALSQQGATMLNPNRDTSHDNANMAEAAIGGGAMGAMFAPLGIAGDRFARRGLKRPGGIDLDAGKGAPAAPPVDPNVPVEPTGPTVAERASQRGRAAIDALRDFVNGKRAEPTDLDRAQKLAEGGDLVDDDALSAVPVGSPEAVAIVKQGAVDAFNRAKQWATELAAEKLTPENKAKLQAAAQDLGSKANQATIAGLKVASDAVQTLSKKAADLKAAFAAHAAASTDERMSSGSTEGGRLAVANALKDATGDERLAATHAAPTADVIDAMQSGARLSDHMYAKIVEAFGPDAEHVLSTVHDEVFPRSTKRTEQFYEALAGLSEYVHNQKGLDEMVTSSVLPEHQDDLSPRVVRELVGHLKEYVRGDHTAGHGPAAVKAKETQFQAELRTVFGDKTDDVIARFAKDAKNSEKMVNDRQFGENGGENLDVTNAGVAARDAAMNNPERLTEGEDLAGQFERSRYYGGGKDKKNPTFVERAEIHREKYKNSGPAEKLLEQAQRENPDRTVDYVSARDYAVDHGLTDAQLSARTQGRPDDFVMIEARGMKTEGRLTKADVDGMKLDTEKFGDSKSRIDTPVTGVTLDAKRLMQVMRGKNKDRYTASDDKGWMQRTARLFFEGIGGASEAIGARIDLNNNGLVVARKGGTDVTLGDLKKVSLAPEDEIDGRHERSDLTQAQLLNRLAAHQQKMEALIVKSRALAAKEKDGTITGRDRYELKRNREKYREMMEFEKIYEDSITRRADADRKAANAEEAGHEVPPDGQIHTAVDVHGENDVQVNHASDKLGDSQGLWKDVGTPANPEIQVTALGRAAVEGRIKSFEAAKSGTLRNVASMARQLDKMFGRLNEHEQLMMLHFAGAKTKGGAPDNVLAAQIINDLAKDHGIRPENFKAAKKPEPVAKTVADLVNAGGESLQKVIDRAASATDVKALQRSVDQIADNPSKHSVKALEAINARLDQLTEHDPQARYELLMQREGGLASNLIADAPKAKAKLTESPLTAEQRAEMQRLDDLPELKSEAKTDPSRNLSDKYRAEVEDRIRKVLGPSVEIAWEDMLHAGDFTKRTGNPKLPDVLDLIQLSTHALDPHSVASHEALHAFISQLRDSGDHEFNRVLFKAADSASVRKQLEQHFANEPEVLKQIRGNDSRASEERAAYMYQLWSDPNVKFEVGTKTHGVFGRIEEFIRKVLGIWSNDERALHIMEYLQQGKYAENIGDRVKIRTDLSAGTSAYVEAAKAWTKPLRSLANAVAGVGEARLRDTGVPALQQIADLIHTPTSKAAANGDTGYINAARVQYSRSINELSKALGTVAREHLDEALNALHTETQAKSPEALKAQQAIRASLDKAFAHMKEAGVEIGDLGPEYFPRVWDVDTLTRKSVEFKAMLQKYVDAGQLSKVDADQVIAKLIGNQGAELGIETLKPGMQHAKVRRFDFITAEDAAPFLSKDLYGTMNSYLQQAARRAEWTRRFGEGNSKLEMMRDAAVRDGATAEQLALTARYLNGVNGTLGDDINPMHRKFFANSIVYENVRLLSLGIFSSAPDAAGIFVRGGTVHDAFDTFKRGFKEIARGLKKAENQKDDEGYKLAQDLGVIDNAILQHTVGSAYSQDLAGFSKKVNEGFFKYNLMDQYNRSMRVGATIAAVKFLAKHHDGTFSNHSERWLAELGLKPGDVVMKGADARAVEMGGLNRVLDEREPLLTHQDFVDAGYSEADAAAKSTLMAAAVNKWVDGAVLRPNAAQKPIWFNDPHFAVISHLKQFVYAFQENILKRVINEAKHGNYTPAMGLASYVPIMLAADAAKGMIQGGGSQPDWKANWGVSDYLWSATQRAGLFGVGQFAIDSVEHHSGALGLLGPTIEQLAQGMAVAGGRERFGSFALKSMPANALAPLLADAGTMKGDPTPTFAD